MGEIAYYDQWDRLTSAIEEEVYNNTEKPTLRDQFAMAAIQGLIANLHWPANDKETVLRAFDIADLAIKVKQQKEVQNANS